MVAAKCTQNGCTTSISNSNFKEKNIVRHRIGNYQNFRSNGVFSTENAPKTRHFCAIKAQSDRISHRVGIKEASRTICGAGEESEGFIPTKLAVFVSGGGSNLKAIHKSISEGKIYGEITAVVSDKPDCGGCKFAIANGIPVIAFPKGKFAPDGVTTDVLIEQLRQLEVDYVVLAGYLKLLPAELIASFPRKILNIHPSLLPAFGGKGFYGAKVHEGVVRSGARFSGATVHFVDEIYDNGPIIAQSVVPVYPFDSPKDVQERVLVQEHKLYSHVIAAICEDRLTWREDGIPLIRKSWSDCEYE